VFSLSFTSFLVRVLDFFLLLQGKEKEGAESGFSLEKKLVLLFFLLEWAFFCPAFGFS
jgi:hypothetical protein